MYGLNAWAVKLPVEQMNDLFCDWRLEQIDMSNPIAEEIDYRKFLFVLRSLQQFPKLDQKIDDLFLSLDGRIQDPGELFF
jgi:hypothetical protein